MSKKVIRADSPRTQLMFHIVGGGDKQIRDMLLNEGHLITEETNWNKYDALLFTGGEDVHPFFYGERPHPTTNFSLARDFQELRVFHSVPHDFPKVGICRGGQFLNVMSGGRMFQHVNNHALMGTHDIETLENEVIPVTSTHHQMMRPNERNCVILATALEATTKETADTIIKQDSKEWEEDAEVVWYWSTNSLCFQPHPEYVSAKGGCRRYFFDLIEEYLATSTYVKLRRKAMASAKKPESKAPTHDC